MHSKMLKSARAVQGIPSNQQASTLHSLNQDFPKQIHPMTGWTLIVSAGRMPPSLTVVDCTQNLLTKEGRKVVKNGQEHKCVSQAQTSRFNGSTHPRNDTAAGRVISRAGAGGGMIGETKTFNRVVGRAVSRTGAVGMEEAVTHNSAQCPHPHILIHNDSTRPAFPLLKRKCQSSIRGSWMRQRRAVF